MELLDHIRAVFANDLYATRQTDIQIENVTPQCVTCSIALTSLHRNAKGNVMGGVLFTLADFAFAVAVHTDDFFNSGNTVELHWVSSSSTIHYLSATKGDRLVATTQCIKKGHRQALFQISITDSEGIPVALVTTTGVNTASNK